MAGSSFMRVKALGVYRPINKAVRGGGHFNATPQHQAEVLDRLKTGPSPGTALAYTSEAQSPAPGKWTVRTIRATFAWLPPYTLSGAWRLLRRWGWSLHAAQVQLVSPDPEYVLKQARLEEILREAVRQPGKIVALFLDELGYYRWPAPARDWGLQARQATRAGNNQQWRTVGVLTALTGQVNYWDGYMVGRRQLLTFSAQIQAVYTTADRIYVVQDNWNIHTHQDVLTALANWPRLHPVGLPTYAPWLNPIEKLWRWVRQDVLKLHRWVTDWERVRQNVRHFLDQFHYGSEPLLRYVGLLGEGHLASVIRNA
jgi:hypothetical protein